MKTKLSILTGLLLVILVPSVALSKDLSGTIYFKDGTTQSFSSFYHFTHGNISPYYGVKVEYNNSIRNIPYDKIKSFKTTAWTKSNHGPKVEYEITTRTGITAPGAGDCKYKWTVEVEIFDELTGEKRKQKYELVKDGELTITKVVFD